MSKKKQKGTPTRVVTITQSGNTVWAHVSDAYGREITGTAGAARCHPGDAFDFYEGARIALARAFRQNPFPRVPEKTEPEKPDFTKGRWVKASPENRGEVGGWIRIDEPWMSGENYKRGDRYQILAVHSSTAKGVYVIAEKGNSVYIAQREYSVWVPDTSEPKNTEEQPDTFTPSFQINDIVRLHGKPFAESCRGQVGKIKNVYTNRLGSASYDIDAYRKDGKRLLQCCSERVGSPAPLTLIWREEK